MMNRKRTRPRGPSRAWARRLVPAAVVVAALAASVGPVGPPAAAAAAEPELTEYQLKAGCLMKFLEHLVLPPGTFPNADAPYVVGVYGADPFGQDLTDLAAVTVVNDRKVVVRRINQVQGLQGCHLVFIPKTEAAQVPQVLAALGNSPVLTVSEIDTFARRQGGIVNFVIKDQQVRFEISQGNAKAKNLIIKAALLKLAILV